ncbi:MAG: iron-sulfur cluster assembly protein [Thiogranum sp.]
MREQIVNLTRAGEQPARKREPEITGNTREERIVSAIRTVYDPELPVNVYDLGLIYSIEQEKPGCVGIQMTLTAPACPVAGTLPGMVEQAVARLDEVDEVCVELVWEPPWTQDCMSDAARLELGLL